MENKYYTPEIEIWKEVVDYEDKYEVSNLGNVRRKVKNLKSSISAWGYTHTYTSKLYMQSNKGDYGNKFN